MAAAKGVNIQITAETTQATAALKNISQQVDSLAKSRSGIMGLAANFSVLSSAASSLGGIMQKSVSIVSSLVNEYAGGARMTAALGAQINTLGASCSVTTKDILDYADSLSRMTTYDDDAIVGVQQLLISTKNLSKDGLQQATALALDMSTALGNDASQSARKLAQVLTDPIKNIGSLKDANIQFTASETAQIKTLQESGKMWEAQKAVLAKVQSVYGGVAKAVGDTDIGKLDRISNAAGNLREALGKSLTNAISPYLDSIFNSIVRIQNWIDSHNKDADFAKAMQSGGSLSSFETDYLSAQWSSRSKEKRQVMKDAMESGLVRDGKIIDPAELTGGRADLVTPAQMEIVRRYNEINQEQSRIEKELASRNKATPKVNEAVPSLTVSSGDDVDMLAKYGAYSSSYQLRQKQHDLASATVQWARESDPQKKQYWDEIRTTIKGQIDEMLAPSGGEKAPGSNAIGDFLSSHSGQSTTMQVAAIDSQLAQAKALQKQGGLTDQEADSIQEVINSLEKQKESLLGVGDATDEVKSKAEKYAEGFQSATKYISQATQMLGAFQDLGNQLMQNEVDELGKKLDDAKTKWDDYFDSLEKRQETQKESLGVMYDEGLVSAEEYTSALTELDQAYEDSKKQRQEEEDALQAEKNKAAEKQFNANKLNSIANVLIQGAQSVAAVWANPGYPAAIPLTVMLGAMNTAQVATIASQKYTPMAVGGIVQSPTHAYIGEGAEAEAVMPLSHLSRMLSSQGMDANGGGVINVHISMGDVYDPDQIAEQVYQGINRAQERGVLPAWSVR